MRCSSIGFVLEKLYLGFFYLNNFQVMIMKILEHPNIVNLIEVIDDPETDHFYMGTLIFLFSFLLVLFSIFIL